MNESQRPEPSDLGGGGKPTNVQEKGKMKEVAVVATFEARVIEEEREWWEDPPKAGCHVLRVTLQSYIGTGRRSGQYHTLTVIHRGRTR